MYHVILEVLDELIVLDREMQLMVADLVRHRMPHRHLPYLKRLPFFFLFLFLILILIFPILFLFLFFTFSFSRSTSRFFSRKKRHGWNHPTERSSRKIYDAGHH